ncbi:MAG TPA: methyltransferase [Geminicoccaceae bacterium]|nr:methyltransferase [Geminicoccaceae bacterium]
MSTVWISPNRIMELGSGYWASKVLLSAVELGLFTELAEAALDGETLRRRLGLHERGARDFLDALVALGMLGRRGGRYLNTLETDLYLDRRKDSYIGGILDMANARLYGFWGALTEALRTGQPQNETRTGGDLFERLYGEPEALGQFLRAMTGISLPVAGALAGRFAWRGCQTFLDVGTAEGAFPVAIAQAHPHLTGVGFDLPPVRPAFEAYVRRHGLADRVRFQAGDLLCEPLPMADVLIMGHILHDWDLDTKRALLAKAHAALPSGGALLVYDRMIDDDRRTHVAGLLMSLNMLIETPGGFDYTGADCLNWLREAGFGAVHVEPLSGPYSLAVGIK